MFSIRYKKLLQFIIEGFFIERNICLNKKVINFFFIDVVPRSHQDERLDAYCFKRSAGFVFAVKYIFLIILPVYTRPDAICIQLSDV